MGRALRYLVEPRVGDPFVVAEGMSEELSRWIKAHLPSGTAVPVKILTVFTHPSVELEFDSPSVPAYRVNKLRKHTALTGTKMPAKSYEELAAALERVTLA